VIRALTYNAPIIKKKDYWYMKKKRGNHLVPPLSGLNGARIEPLVPLLTFIASLNSIMKMKISELTILHHA